MAKLVFRSLGLCVGIIFAGCGSRSGGGGQSGAPLAQPTPSPAQPTPTPVPAALGVSDATAQTLLTKYCTSCHDGSGAGGAPVSVVLTTSASAKKTANAAVALLTTSDQDSVMPPKDPGVVQPTADDRAKLVAWFNQ